MKPFSIADATVRDLAQAENFGDADSLAGPPVVEGSRLVAWFPMLWEVTTGPASALERSSALNGLVAALATQGVPSEIEVPAIGAELRAVALAREFLHAYPTEEISLADLAEVAGLSPYHRLNRAFSQAVGVPPHAYQVQSRVLKARTMLLEGASIAEAANRAGFADQRHLGRHFKKLVALSLGKYRRDALLGHDSLTP